MILVTGSEGFIGAHLCQRLQAEGVPFVGVDWADKPRIDLSGKHWLQIDIADPVLLDAVFKTYPIDTVVNLAAQAGVRHPVALDYAHSNLTGFVNVLDHCQRYGARLIYASSSSVYGDAWPQVETARTDSPLSLYAATKKANELMAHASGIDAVGLRFFTVYGPWGRPDMIPLMFTRKILAGEVLDLYNYGEYWRDFTYIDDIIDGLMRAIRMPLRGVFNIGRGHPTTVNEFVSELEAALNTKADLRLLPPLAGEAKETHADLTEFSAATGYAPQVDLADGLREMVAWYRA